MHVCVWKYVPLTLTLSIGNGVLSQEVIPFLTLTLTLTLIETYLDVILKGGALGEAVGLSDEGLHTSGRGRSGAGVQAVGLGFRLLGWGSGCWAVGVKTGGAVGALH